MSHLLLTVGSWVAAGYMTVLADDWSGYRHHLRRYTHVDPERVRTGGHQVGGTSVVIDGHPVCTKRGFAEHRRTKW